MNKIRHRRPTKKPIISIILKKAYSINALYKNIKILLHIHSTPNLTSNNIELNVCSLKGNIKNQLNINGRVL